MIQLDPTDPRAIAYREATDRLTKLQVEKRRQQDALTAATMRDAELKRLQQASNLEREAGALIGEPDGAPSSMPANIAQLEHDISVLALAVEKQVNVINEKRSAFSRAMCEINRPEYLEIEKRILRAAGELAAANEAEMRFFDAMSSAGCNTVFRPMRINLFGIASDPQSVAALHRREVEQFLPEILKG